MVITPASLWVFLSDEGSSEREIQEPSCIHRISACFLTNSKEIFQCSLLQDNCAMHLAFHLCECVVFDSKGSVDMECILAGHYDGA